MINVIKTLGKRSYPARSQTPEIARYQSHKLGWFFHYPFDVTYSVPDIRRRMPIDVDWTSMAAQAAAAGNVDFVCLHIIDESGMVFFDQDTQFNDGVSLSDPTVPVYGFGLDAGHSLVSSYGLDYYQRYITAFKNVGIDVGAYISLGRSTNYYPSTVHEAEYIDYMKLLLSEIGDKYMSQLDLVFWDNLASILTFSDADKRELYDNLKNKNKKALIVGNIWINDGTFFSNGVLKWFPVDVLGLEWYKVPDHNIAELNTAVTVSGGQTYYMPRQYSYSGLYRYLTADPAQEAVSYPWLQPEYLTTWTKNQIRTQNQFQAAYNEARMYNMVFWANVPIKHDGTLDATYMSRLQNLVL